MATSVKTLYNYYVWFMTNTCSLFNDQYIPHVLDPS